MAINGQIIHIEGHNTTQVNAVARWLSDHAEQHYFLLSQTLLASYIKFIDNQLQARDFEAFSAITSGMARKGAHLLVVTDNLEKAMRDALTQCWAELDIIHVSMDIEADHDTNKTIEELSKEILAFLHSRILIHKGYIRWAADELRHEETPPGEIIIVVGTSSAGKSTLCHAINAQSPLDYYQLGIDALYVHMLSPRFVDALPKTGNDTINYPPATDAKHGFYCMPANTPPHNPHNYIFQQIGFHGRLGMSALFNAIKNVSLQGFNIIADMQFIFPDICQEAIDVFKDLPTTWVKINTDISIIEQREKDRGDRIIGIAKGLHLQSCYDFTPDIIVDTGVDSAETVATKIIANK